MRRLFILSILALPFIFSCKKNNGGSSNNPVDTLATGWKHIFFVDPANLEDIFFINNTGFTISPTNIYKSVDGGNNWTRLNETAPNFMNIGMGSENNAAFVVAPNFILSTHNAGTSFDTAILADNHLTDIFFVGSSIAYAAGKSIWKTTDGGVSWTKLHTFTTDSTGYKSLYFLNEQTGWVIRKDGLYATFNGGAGWNKVPTNGFDFSTTGNVFFRTSTTGFITDQNSFGKTNSGGASWTKTFTGTPTYHDIHFVTDTIGYITDGTRIYKTTDGGSTWKTEVFLVDRPLVELHFTDVDHGWACGSDGTILKFNQ
ncbi:MAG: hypothetical protein E6H06_13710 [Bacteroidetes bacterium]|nr:MAG: hypothetical protein E6H06_13710 [Bacteroidota bacterium]